MALKDYIPQKPSNILKDAAKRRANNYVTVKCYINSEQYKILRDSKISFNNFIQHILNTNNEITFDLKKVLTLNLDKYTAISISKEVYIQITKLSNKYKLKISQVVSFIIAEALI